MSKLQLLSPAGSFDALKAAIDNGADAVYLGSKLFNARRLANNFTGEELKQAVQYAHLHNVKIYLTLNTLIKNNEIVPLLNQVSLAAQLNIDALIMQDLTFAPLIKQHFPKLEIHASTQSTIMNSPSVKYWQPYVDTFVLARELTKQEVKTIYENTNANLEVFIHGHLCISYSGQCLISSLIGKRSGNRGLCASSCRKPYNGPNYLLSAKDLCMIENIQDVIASGAKTVKIEGRMKPAEYVGTTTSQYRKEIDNYYNNNNNNNNNNNTPRPISQNTINQLRMAFNREFTPGYFNNEIKIVDQTYSSKRGIFLGTINNGQLTLEHDIELYDGIGIINHGKRTGDYIQKIIHNFQEVPSAKKGDTVKLIIAGFDNYAKVYLMSTHNGQNPLGTHQLIPFDLTITIQQQKPTLITFNIKNKTNRFNLTIPASLPQKHPFTKEQIRIEMEKYQSTLFHINQLIINTDNSFIPKSELTNLRKQLDQYLLDALQPILNEKIKITPPTFSKTTASEKKIHVHVYTMQGIKDAIQANADIIYYDAFAKDLNEAITLTKNAKNTQSKLYLYTPMALTDMNIEQLQIIINTTQPDGILTNNIAILNLPLPQHTKIILGYQLNIFNDNQLQFYNPAGAIASIELNTQELSQFQHKDKLIYFAHGYPVVMSFKEQFETDHLTDEKHYTFRLRKNSTGTTEMLYSKQLGLLQHTPDIVNAGITQLYLDLEKDVFQIITLYKRLLNGEQV